MYSSEVNNLTKIMQEARQKKKNSGDIVIPCNKIFDKETVSDFYKKLVDFYTSHRIEFTNELHIQKLVEFISNEYNVKLSIDINELKDDDIERIAIKIYTAIVANYNLTIKNDDLKNLLRYKY